MTAYRIIVRYEKQNAVDGTPVLERVVEAPHVTGALTRVALEGAVDVGDLSLVHRRLEWLRGALIRLGGWPFKSRQTDPWPGPWTTPPPAGPERT